MNARSPQVFVLQLDRASAPDPEPLAHALAASPFWSDVESPAALVVRRDPQCTPLLAIFGRFDSAQRAQIAALAGQLECTLPHTRYVDYARAERDCAALAQRLTDRLGSAELGRASFTALPRGGLIVLGMLSYHLDLRPDRMRPPYPGDAALVVVDDCALTGARFRRFLSSSDHPRVVFAHLYSHPDLRAAIERREPRVTACVSAHELDDHAPALQGERYDDWRRGWERRNGDSIYWVGVPDHVCFAWSEPDFTIWNPVAGAERALWRTVPPDRCLKNRAGAARRPNGGPAVQVQPRARGRFRPAARVVYARLNGTVVLADVRAGTSIALDGSAADMWDALMRHGELAAASAALARSLEAPRSCIESDLRALVAALERRGLLEMRHAR